MSSRREFITLLGGAAAAGWPLAAKAQQAMPVVGILGISAPDTIGDRLRMFRLGLKEAGYIDGENLVIEYRWTENQSDRLPELVADFVRKQVAVITTVAGASLAAKLATTSIPIVFIATEDPVRLGLVASLARPGGNLTGINIFSAELVAKRLELVRELLPSATRIAVLIRPTGPSSEATLRDIEPAAHVLGLQVQVLNASTAREIDAAFATLRRERLDALFLGADPFFTSRRVQLANSGDAACRSNDIGNTRSSRSWRADKLWCQYRRWMATSGRLCRSYPQRNKACGPASRAVDQVRAGNQRSDRSYSRCRCASRVYSPAPTR